MVHLPCQLADFIFDSCPTLIGDESSKMTDVDDEGNMPWSALNAYFKFLREDDNGNCHAQCKLCPAGPKAEKGFHKSSASNLKAHLVVS